MKKSAVGVRVWRTEGHVKNTSRMSCLMCHANHSATYWKRNSFTIKETGRNGANGAEQWGVSCFLCWNMAKACQSACEPKALQSVRLWLHKWLHKTSYQSHAKRNRDGKPKSIFGWHHLGCWLSWQSSLECTLKIHWHRPQMAALHPGNVRDPKPNLR